MKKIPVGILGATGMVGQQYLELLCDHPWFEVVFLAASDSSAGKSYAQAISGRSLIDQDRLLNYAQMVVHKPEEVGVAKKLCRLVFSAMSNDGAKCYEELYADNGIAVISNASYHRSTPDVPILIPEVNPEHAEIIKVQQSNRQWSKGFIVAKPNCSLQSYMIPLAPLHREFGVRCIMVTTMQAISGSGYPGVPSFDILGNIIPYIANEEEKSEQEPLKIWGQLEAQGIALADGIKISAQCNRVPVVDGHMAAVSVRFERLPACDDIIGLWNEFRGEPQRLKLPSAPANPIEVCLSKDRPQPRRDAFAGGGMGVSVGRLRPCPVLDYRFVALSHNTIRGAAGGGVLNAEYLLKAGYIQ